MPESGNHAERWSESDAGNFVGLPGNLWEAFPKDKAPRLGPRMGDNNEIGGGPAMRIK